MNQLIPIVGNAEGPVHCWINQNATFSFGYCTEAQTVEYA